MKSIIKQPKIESEAITGPRYWRSLDELVDKPEFKDFIEKEFPLGASELDGVNRRQFLKIMAASFAAAGMGMAGCRRPVQYILPYSKQPENVIPGVPVFYTTSHPSAKDNQPLLVETHQHRPSKIEGNPAHSPYGGATDIYSQASVLDLYDPDRSTKSSEGTRSITQGRVYDLLQEIHNKFVSTEGQGLAFLAEQSTSPTRSRIVEQIKKIFPRSTWAEYEPINFDNPEIATRRLFGRPLRPHYNFRNAKRILSLDADFLNSEPGQLANSRAFAVGRRVNSSKEADNMNRLYQVESNFSTTGAMADHRLRLSSGQIPAFTALLAIELLKQKSIDSPLSEELQKKAAGLETNTHWIEECIADLIANPGKAVVTAGSHQPVEVHELVFFINDLLGANGHTVNYLNLPNYSASTIQNLGVALENGRIETLIIVGGNPAYNAPADLNWLELQKSVTEVVRYGYFFDETSIEATYHISATHYLESWSDGRTFDGTVVPVQPMIRPLFEGLQEIELLARLAGMDETDPYALVKETIASLSDETDKERGFNRFLSDGVLKNSNYANIPVSVNQSQIKRTVATGNFRPTQVSSKQLEVRIIPSPRMWDGTYNNNGWLQECPEAMTKLTWDNAISISPRLAKDIGYDPEQNSFKQIASKNTATFKMGREVSPLGEITIGGTTVRGPVHIQPGLANYTVVIPLGYGRTKVGRIGKGTGFTAYPLVNSQSPGYVAGANINITDKSYLLANTQEHWSMEGRALVREANVEDYSKHPDFVDKMGLEAHSPPVYGSDSNLSLQEKVTTQPRGESAYEIPQFGGDHQWGMSIDLNTCTACSACIVACQSENNIPIVGKDQVTRGREMHWLRFDRYYSSGDVDSNKREIPEDPQATVQPVMCMHCETAPCEQVCPVNATVHDDEGLNVMSYNRCVGTRYCSNNCPYKVRRFNFFDWNKREIGSFYKGPLGPGGMTELEKMQKNPDVSVRMRGVMEKCTYCQQRIQEAKINTKVKARDSGDIKVPDGTIKTACQQVCPTDSIVFGDISDPESKVSITKNSDRDYSVLGYLNTRPRTTYLARLRNPNPLMPDYREMPLSRMEYENKFGHGAHGEDSHEKGNGHEEHHNEASDEHHVNGTHNT
jgi:MoCo/4Fe-4S cofactor protein with predicted Tat translocation signal